MHSIGLESGRSAAAACSRIFKQYGTLTISRTAFVSENTISKARFDILGKARGQIGPLDDELFSQYRFSEYSTHFSQLGSTRSTNTYRIFPGKFNRKRLNYRTALCYTSKKAN